MTQPTFTIITPSLQRPLLHRCANSVSHQTYPHWQHVIAIDGEQIDTSLLARCYHPQQTWIAMGQRYGNYGNHARHRAWEYATGDQIIFLDDDNFLADQTILADLAAALASVTEPWSLFPIHRHGSPFFHDPPRLCFVDSANMVIRREHASWPDIVAREADGVLCEQLKSSSLPYRAFPDFRPIIVMEASSNGQ